MQLNSSSLTTAAAITSLAFQAGNPSLNIGTGALTAGAGTFSGAVSLGTIGVGGTVSQLLSLIGRNAGDYAQINFLANNGSTNQAFLGASPSGFDIATGGVIRGTFSSTGLAVTGAISADSASGGVLNIKVAGVQKGAISTYVALSGSGSDYSPTYFSETGLGCYWAVNGTTTKAMTLDTSGNLLVGGTSALGNNKVSIETSTSDGWAVRNTTTAAGRYWSASMTGDSRLYLINASSTGVYMNYGDTSWSGISDERFKDIIEPITNATSKVAALRSVIGKFKTDEIGTRRSFLIAQDVQAVFPEAVSAEDPEALGVRYTDVVPLLVAAIQELSADLTATKARLAALEAK